jgi:glycosyltransferase involved in cell wall biosynthesis
VVASGPRVALACPGVGLVQRGFERMFGDLFRVLGETVEVTTFKGGGPVGPRERVLRFARRNGSIPRLLPVHRLVGRTPYYTECATFALALLPRLVRGRFDVVHVVDLPLARCLFWMRSRLGLGFRLLYTEGSSAEPRYYPPADHIHQISEAARERATRYGIAESLQTLVPVGVFPERFAAHASREELRARHGIPRDAFVVLSVAALNRYHKRTDYLIEEAVGLPPDTLLWLDGSLDHGDPDLVDVARRQLGKRCRVTQVPSDQVGELYALADVMVLGSLDEAFGLSIVEASIAGLPVLTHDAPHFRWLFPEADDHVDMTRPGALAARLVELRDPARRAARRRSASTRDRFGWDRLRDRYLEMYDKVMREPVRRADPIPRERAAREVPA